MASNFFDERSGIVPCNTDWGRWWQTVDEVHIEVKLSNRIKSKDTKVIITNQSITVKILEKILFSVSIDTTFTINCFLYIIKVCFIYLLVLYQQGNLFRKVHGDESIWLLEDEGTLLKIILIKADYIKKEIVWESLLEDGSFKADPITYIEMKKKIDLEKFQIEVRNTVRKKIKSKTTRILLWVGFLEIWQIIVSILE